MIVAIVWFRGVVSTAVVQMMKSRLRAQNGRREGHAELDPRRALWVVVLVGGGVVQLDGWHWDLGNQGKRRNASVHGRLLHVHCVMCDFLKDGETRSQGRIDGRKEDLEVVARNVLLEHCHAPHLNTR